MKPYPAVMKEKRRYLIFEVVSEGNAKHDRKSVTRALWDAVFENIGAFGAAETAFWVVDFDEKTQQGVARCTNDGIDRVRACLALLSNINNKKAYVYIHKVSGTVKKSLALKEGL